jgi:hypothetical protein
MDETDELKSHAGGNPSEIRDKIKSCKEFGTELNKNHE